MISIYLSHSLSKKMQISSHSDICNIHAYKSKLFDRLIDISYQEQLTVPKYFFF